MSSAPKMSTTQKPTTAYERNSLFLNGRVENRRFMRYFGYAIVVMNEAGPSVVSAREYCTTTGTLACTWAA